ncbi:septum site-determining protein MinC [Luteimonas huabeiensis]|uniref:septum site-determining protein MinC n=1 Tax=Luteimonas huabeiensis TaxID=1244513 RepID=UPI0004634A68|nr:septum site-determining protein MinC [Luteimonas huabeiensis]
MAATHLDFEPAGELKFGQVGIANLRVRRLDPDRLAAEMRDRVARAPNLFARAAVVIDFGGLPATPEPAQAQALIAALREAGVLPVALAWGSADNARLAEALGLPLLSKFRAQYERGDGGAETPPPAAAAPEPAPEPAPAPPPAPPAAAEPGLMQSVPVRSGQQIYAEHRDLTVLGAVGAGAEVIADGSIHIYGPLRGRALAGARGNARARIFCRGFQAELVAVAGHYKVLEEIPKALHGKAVQVWLEGEELRIAALD